jgi:hypothetical protein
MYLVMSVDVTDALVDSSNRRSFLDTSQADLAAHVQYP